VERLIAGRGDRGWFPREKNRHQLSFAKRRKIIGMENMDRGRGREKGIKKERRSRGESEREDPG